MVVTIGDPTPRNGADQAVAIVGGEPGRTFRTNEAGITPSQQVRPHSPKSDKNTVGGRIGGRSGDNGMLVHGLDSEAAADPTEIAAVEKIGLSVLAECEDQRLVAALSRDVQRID